MLLLTLARTGGMPTASNVGKVSSVPDPTTALILPAPIPATRTNSASNHVIVARLYAPDSDSRSSVRRVNRFCSQRHTARLCGESRAVWRYVVLVGQRSTGGPSWTGEVCSGAEVTAGG